MLLKQRRNIYTRSISQTLSVMNFSILKTLIFFAGVQEKLGILNNGIVYAVFDYEAHNPDELNFKEGDRLTVLRKGDEWEREWWWSRVNDKEGYIPRNLLGVSC